jgi:hypothetical protein
MKKRIETVALSDSISLLQIKQALELKLLKEQFYVTYESLKPINLVKSTLSEVTSSSSVKNNIINNIIGLTTGYLTKKVLVGSSHNPIKRMLGMLLQFAIANVVSRHSGKIKTTGEIILNHISHYRKEVVQD